jgi:hypothetical protein
VPGEKESVRGTPCLHLQGVDDSRAGGCNESLEGICGHDEVRTSGMG